MRHRLAFVTIVILSGRSVLAGDHPALKFTPLDDFEDASPWVKGDPNTDLAQKDAAVTTSTEFVKQGKQSLAFLIRVNWTPRPNEKYAKGWPMMRRTFDRPRDWSQYDYLAFWLYAKTNLDLLQPRVLRVGFPTSSKSTQISWHTIEGIKPNVWQQVLVPLDADTDWRHVTGISFYVAEAWYNDGDKVDFYLDDMRLARRTTPSLMSCAVTSRIFPRGQAVAVRVKVEGPLEGVRCRCRITDTAGNQQFADTQPVTAKQQQILLRTEALPAGGHYAHVELLDKAGKVVDSRRQYFRSLQPGKCCYLKLITFYTKPIRQVDPERLKVLNDSAYAGVAIPMLGSYDTAPVPGYDAFAPSAKAIRDALKIDPWPWIVINRIIGVAPDGRSHANSHAKNPDYFRRIKALDLDNETGARSDMLKTWRSAVRLAREWKSPGVMIDLEAYNNYRTYRVDYVAKARNESIDDVIAKCEKLGADFAKIIEEEYPACTVWSLFSRLELRQVMRGYPRKIHTTVSYFTLGLLKYAKAHNVPLKFLCGGETTPGYVNKDVAALKARIAQRDADVADYLEQFPRRFFLAGTISPFHDYSITTSWIQKRYHGTNFKTIEDFEPMFKTLFDAYDWVWIYASSAGKTAPYDPRNNARYSAVLRAALAPSAVGK